MRHSLRIFTVFAIAILAFCPGLSTSTVLGLNGSTGPDGSNAQAVQDLGYYGQGVNVGLISSRNVGPLDVDDNSDHEAFKDLSGDTHAFNHDYSGDGILASDHDTRMAGIIASRGRTSTDPNDSGVAPQSDIYSARVGDDDNQITQTYLQNALNELVNTQDCRVIVTGIALQGTSAPPDGTSLWTKMYDYYAYEYDVIFANPAGNSDTVIDVFGDAYNGITTGGLRFTDPDVYGRVGTLSGLGLTDDGRDKPDIVCPSKNQTMPNAASSTAWSNASANNYGWTSYSTPHTGGVAALLLNYADSTAGETDDDRSEVIKAVIVNSALPNIDDKLGNPTTMQTFDNDRGYGRIDALRAYDVLSAGKIAEGSTTTQQMGWAYDILPSGGDSYFITANKDQRLVLTVTWHRKITKSGSIYSTESSPFGIDLTVEDQGNNVIFRETDTLNNLEKIDILLTSDGVYEIKLAKSTYRSGRDYGLAFELVDPIPGDFDLNYVVDENDLMNLTSEWLATGAGLQADMIDTGPDIVDLSDFAEFSKYWLIYDPAYYSP